MAIIGITMGCPVGIGPEIILGYLSEKNIYPSIRPVILGDIGVLRRCTSERSLDLNFMVWEPGTQLPSEVIPVVSLSQLDDKNLEWGSPNIDTAHAMAHYIKTGVDLTEQGFLDGITTCPISKASLNEAGFDFPGHTEMLASLTKTSDYCMMMAGTKLRVTLVTIHCSLTKVPLLLTRQSVGDLIKITDQALKIDFGLKNPRIAVAGLNPHAGENLLFGDEEQKIISPAIEDAQNQDIDAQGPYPPDTVFLKAAAGEFDAVVCMYHDQGLIPFKLLHFEDGVNLTLGLPIVRTSVDHGTAYDIAGKGVANHQSLQEAVHLAATISTNRKQYFMSQEVQP